VAPFDGDLDDYQRFLLDEARRAREALKESQKPAAPPPANRKIAPRTKALKRDLGKVEQCLAALETQRRTIEQHFDEPLSPQEIGEFGLELQAVNDALAENEEEWLRLSERIEAENSFHS
jgi:ATP-binding cassette subfamily F protein 3